MCVVHSIRQVRRRRHPEATPAILRGGASSDRDTTDSSATHPVKAEVSKDPDGSVSLSKASAAKGDKVTVEASFSWVNPFADVANNAYYVRAVEWMLKRKVTQGTMDTTFSLNLNCTRAQIVTFLWRAAGSPEPKGTVSFADVPAGSYYAKAVAWAIENGITDGIGGGLFGSANDCTRAQIAAFLFRAYSK